ncbi:MAG: radical SAM protein [Deltaproteobacteria bacterium]|nr:radical SAM protein [Deltaproteobacteria bacterium]
MNPLRLPKDLSSTEALGHLDRRASLLAQNVLHLVILPTEQCNFRCTYCYEDFALGRMSEGVSQGIRRLLQTRAPNLDRLTLSWFGGEPLAAYDRVEEIQGFAAHLGQSHPRLKLRGEITTNGYLLSQMRFEKLLSLGVKVFQISLDGPQEIHDQKRLRADGSGTFQRIWSHLQAISEVTGDFEVILRLHVDRENHLAMRKLLRQIAATFGKEPRFRLFIRKLSRLGGANDAQLPVLVGIDGEKIVRDLRSEAASLGLSLKEPEKGESICYASATNSFVIRSNGAISKCTVALTDSRNLLGRISQDGSLEIDADKLNGWARGLLSGNSEELRCPLQGLPQLALARPVAMAT